MGFLDRLLGRGSGPESRSRQDASASSRAGSGGLTPEQRRLALRDLSAAVPEHERVGGDDPRSLARMATRAETSRPGTIERAFGGGGGVLGGMGGTLLTSFAAAFAGTLVAQSLFSEPGGEEAAAEGDAGAEGDQGDAGGDTGGGDFGGGDFGG